MPDGRGSGHATIQKMPHCCNVLNNVAAMAAPDRDPEPAATPLARALHDPPPDKPGPIAAFELARRAFLAGRRVEMQPIAAELGVDRATLYRWVGNRDALLAEVVWTLTESTFRQIEATTGGSGALRVIEVITRMAHSIVEADYLRTFLRREPERALRLLTTTAGIVQVRTVALVEALLVTECPRPDGYPLPAHDLAYLIVRIGESFVYADVIAGGEPDPDKVGTVLRILLGSAPTGESPRPTP